MTLPTDPAMLLSVVNMYLRDEYSSLDAFCEDKEVDRAQLESTLAAAGYEYNPQANKFW